MHYYKFNIADYRKDTSHLSTLEHGIYRQLIDWYYLDEKPIPLETESVMRRLRLSSDDVSALKNVLQDFFECRATGYHQPRCDLEINDYHHNSAINKENGKLGGRPKKTERVISANRTESESKGNHKPLTINQEPLTNSKTARGTRLPADFQVDVDFALAQGLTNHSEEAAKFRDYWNSQPGQRGVKLDWQATWRNWCRSAKKPTQGRYMPPQPNETVPGKQEIDPAIAKIMKDELIPKGIPQNIRAKLSEIRK